MLLQIKPLRLLYITAETWPTFRPDVAVLFGKYLPALGVESDLVTAATPGTEPVDRWSGGQAQLAPMTGSLMARAIRRTLHGMKCLWQADSGRYDAIQVRDMPAVAVFALAFARLKGVRFYYWMSFPIPEGQLLRARGRGLSAGLARFLVPWLQGTLGFHALYRIVLPRADHVFVQSDRMLADMEKHGLPARKMTPVPMGVDLEAMGDALVMPIDDPRIRGRRVLVYLGALDRARQIEVLFDMLARARSVVPEVLLVLVGDTEDRPHRVWLEAQARDAGVWDSVIWTGWLPTVEAWRWVRTAEIGLSPIPRGPLFDPASPTKLPEYLALGVPVVCNDNPDQQHIIDHCQAGRCVPYAADSFAKAVIELLGLPAAARQQLAQRGRAFVAEHRDYRLIASRLAARYHEILATPDATNHRRQVGQA